MATRSRSLAGVVFLWSTVSGCGGSLETEARMFRHFGQAHLIHSAAIFGRIGAARDAGARLAAGAPVPGMPAGSAPYVLALQQAAEAVEQADSPERLPYLSAQVADRCGACHAAFDVGPAFGIGRTKEASGVRGHMAVHSWASERMWEALISRNGEMWLAGAEALSGRPIDADEFPMVRDQGSAFLLSSRTHYLAKSSVEIEGWEARAGLLSRLLSTCYECHRLAEVR